VPSRFTHAALAAAVSLASLASTACSSGTPLPDGEGDPGAGSEAITVSARSGVCNRSKVMASVSGARRTVLERGFSWLDQNVPYSQSRTFNGYRTDCSGFVSMCWETGTSFTTAIFASGGGNSTALGSWNELVPGDALVRRGHMMLFTGWADNAKSGVCVLEQASTASDMQFRVRAVASLRGEAYEPIRSRELGSAGAPSPSPSGEEPAGESTEEPPPTEEAPVADPPAETSPDPNTPDPNTPDPTKPAPDLNTPEPGTAPDEGTPSEEPAAEEPDDAASPSGGTKKTKTTKKKAAAGDGTEDEAAAYAAPPSACAASPRGPRGAVPAPRSAAFAGVGLALAVLARRRRPRGTRARPLRPRP
jgi:hypothetical protein